MQSKVDDYASVFEFVSDGIVFVDHEGIVRKSNPAITAILGYEEEELLGKPFFNLAYKKETLKEITSHSPLRRFYCAEETSMEMTLFHKQGQAVAVRFRAVLMKNQDDKVTQIVGIIEPMAEQTVSGEGGGSLAEKMWEAQQNFEKVLDHSADAIAICDITGNVMIANKAFLQLLGYAQEDVDGRHIVEFTPFREGTYQTTIGEDIFISNEDVTRTAEFSMELFEKGYSRFESHLVRHDNIIVPVDFTMSLLKDPEGERRGSLIVAKDRTKRAITDRELARKTEDLKKTKEQQEQLIENSLNPIVIGDKDGTIMRANKAFLNLVGKTGSEVLGKDILYFSPREGTYTATTGEQIVVGEDFQRDAEECLTRFFETGSLINWATYFINKNNRIIPVSQNIVMLHNKAGEPIASLGIIHDISEQRKAELAFIAAKETAEAANRSKSAFLANMSHEIRTPMNGVIGFTDMLLDSNLNEEQVDNAMTIKRSGEALLSLINDILDFSKIEAGQIIIEELDFDIEVLASDVCEMVRPKIDADKVELLCRIDDDVPALLRGDPFRYRQVLLNLMGNAVKFVKQGEIELSIYLEQSKNNRVLIHALVRDTGIGIASDKIEDIFERFQQEDVSTSRKFGGTGLGLSICKKISNLMGGNCWAESVVGKGSSFHFTAWLFQPEKTQAQRIAPVALSGKKVVIVDDNSTNLNILTHALEKAGMKVTSFLDARDSLAEVIRVNSTGEPFDIAILDIQMPSMSGYDLAKQIRSEIGDSLPIMAFTSETEGGANKCLAWGFNGYLPKPIRRTKLYKMIEHLLGEAMCTEVAGTKTERTIVTQHSIQEEVKQAIIILLAEDNAVNQKLAVKLLSKAGYTVEVAVNGKEAVEKYVADPDLYDVILMDLQMPILNGLDATKQIRDYESTITDQESRSVPIIAMTANAMTGDREICIEAGMDDYISKPIRRAVVFEILKKWIID
jgi:two-component system sensor histidine kinase/response regulator